MLRIHYSCALNVGTFMYILYIIISALNFLVLKLEYSERAGSISGPLMASCASSSSTTTVLTIAG